MTAKLMKNIGFSTLRHDFFEKYSGSGQSLAMLQEYRSLVFMRDVPWGSGEERHDYSFFHQVIVMLSVAKVTKNGNPAN